MLNTNAAELERLIRELNDRRNQAAPDAVSSIQRQIQSLQRESSAWQIGLDFLDHHEPQIRFYGALTVTIKVNADWDVDNVGHDRDLVSQLIQRLVTSYVRLSAIPDAAYVLQKLCTTLVAVFAKPDSAWAFPSRHVLACTLAGHYIPQESIPAMDSLLAADQTISESQLKSMLMLASTLAEEVGSTAPTTKGHNAEIRTANNAEDVWKLLRFSIQTLTHTIQTGLPVLQQGLKIELSNSGGVEIATTAIPIFPFWTQYVRPEKSESNSNSQVVVDCFKTCMTALCFFFERDELSSLVIQALTTLEQQHHRLLDQVVPEYAKSLMSSQVALTWMDQLLQGDFDAEPTSYVEFLESLMNQADVTTSEYLKNTTYVQALSQIQRLLRCDGIAGVEDTACQTALEILTSIVEGFNDWEEPTQFDDEIRTLVGQVCHDCLLKIQLPGSELSPRTQLWDTDDRARFQDFRYDVHDFLQNAYATLGQGVIERLVQGIVNTEGGMDWSKFEANIFGLVAFSDTMNSEPEKFDQYLVAVFSCEPWRYASTTPDTPERVRKVMIKLVGENTGFLERHKDGLVSSLNFLFSSLHIATSATSASRAIFALCDAQRIMLVEALPQFMSSLTAVSNLESDARSRIFGGVSAIIQALPNEEAKIEPLLQIISLVDSDHKELMAGKFDEAESKVKATDIVWTLATIGKGLRVPNDVSDEADNNIKDVNFWMTGPGQSIQQLTLSIYSSLRQLQNDDSDSLFMEATCDFLKSAFTESHPSPFKFSSSTNLEILKRLINLNNPLPDNILGTASSYLASLKPSDNVDEFTTLLDTVLHQCKDAMALSSSKLEHTEFCAAASEFFGRALARWIHIWLKLPNLEQSAQIMIEMNLALIQDTDTLTRRSAASFFTALFDASGSSKVTLNQVNAAQMETILQIYGPRILAALLHLLGGECARSELESLTEALKRMVQKQPLLASKTLKEALKEENHVLSPKAIQATKPEQRNRFASQVLMLKGARKTNEIVREFWVASKGSSFGYVV